MRDDLQYNLCNGCGERHPSGMGIIAMIQHHCPVNTVTYRPGSFKLRHLRNIFDGTDDMQSFKDLLNFNHFKKMENFETASWVDKNSYSLARDSDVRSMKRLRAYIELEEEFDSKY